MVHDELDLPFGTVRGKLGGGHGGHNGLRSVNVGASAPGELPPACAWASAGPRPSSAATAPTGCSSRFSEPREEVEAMVARAADMVEVALADGHARRHRALPRLRARRPRPRAQRARAPAEPRPADEDADARRRGGRGE